MESFFVGVFFMLFVLFVLVCFGVIFAAAVCFLDIGTKSESKLPFNPFLTEDEQISFTDRFHKYGFVEIPHFMYGIGKIPSRERQMQFSHYSGCYVNVSKNLANKGFRFEIKYKKTVIKTFDDLDNLYYFLWNFNNSYKHNPELVTKTLEVEKREALAAGDFE
jgi:hypothetical protein